MREIKFRAWDKKTGLIRSVTGINWYDEYVWVDETPMSGDKLPIEDTPLMQYTGLKDKNGREIYEGDVLQWIDDEHRTTYCTAEISLEGFRKIEEFKYYKGKVIGNIYENPELLA